jgi:DNA-binding transcriptional regulator YiaG
MADPMRTRKAELNNHARETVCEQLSGDRVILNIKPRDYTPEMAKEVRKTLGMSQTIFAQFLGVSQKAVSAWEQGRNRVPRIAARFFDEITDRPDYWRERVRAVIAAKEPQRNEQFDIVAFRKACCLPKELK